MLDRQRLGKQRIEARQILQTLRGDTSGWKHHPAVKMWKSYERALCYYGIAICNEWIARGYEDHQRALFCQWCYDYRDQLQGPWWLEDPRLHASHRAALLFKAPEHYGTLGWTEKPVIAYWWPCWDKHMAVDAVEE